MARRFVFLWAAVLMLFAAVGKRELQLSTSVTLAGE
jgi:hypothetical protein